MKQSLQEGLHYYLDEWGRLVFTEFYLSERGYCCGSGCRHCPWRGKPGSDKPCSAERSEGGMPADNPLQP